MIQNIHTIDLNFQGQPLSIASFLVEINGMPILIETGPHSTYDHLCDRIRAIGHDPGNIQHVFITHIHLDHAGAAWAFAKNGAKVYLHPKGYRHMHDPSRLLASAKMIYREMMDTLWGTLEPIHEDQLLVIEDGQVVRINETNIVAHHTPGHAKHHIAWQINNIVFTGDVAGISIHGGPIVPPCPPPDIHIEDWIESIEKLLALKNIEKYYLTHFGLIEDPETHMDKLKYALTEYAEFVRPFAEKGNTTEEILPDFLQFTQSFLVSNGLSKEDAAKYEAANPAYMSAAGLMRYWKKKMESE